MLASIGVIMQSSNLYVYCTSNPLMYIDPSGCATCEVYWWGYRITLSSKEANDLSKKLSDLAIDFSFAAAGCAIIGKIANYIAGFLSGTEYGWTIAKAIAKIFEIYSIGYGTLAAYFNKLSKSLANSNKGNGVILDINYWLTFSTKSR